jgi:hypothetical protein
MQMIYNSPNYCVFEFRDEAEPARGGFEIMDKAARREIFIGGALAVRFRENVAELIASQPSVEEVDAFLARFDGLMQQPVTLH